MSDERKAPERIYLQLWMDETTWCVDRIDCDENHEHDELCRDVAYIRADLLPGTVEEIGALLECARKVCGLLPDCNSSPIEQREVRAFLAALSTLTTKAPR